MLMYYSFTPDSVPPNGSEPTWQTSMLYSNIIPRIYVNETICMVICPSGPGWTIWCQDYPKMHLMDGGPGAILSFKTFLSFINRLLVTYNIQLKTSRGVLFLPPSDAYVKSFLCLLYTLIKLYYTKAQIDQASIWPQIEFFFSGGQESWRLLVQQQPFNLLSSPSPPAPNPSQHQGLFQWVNTSHEVAKVLEFQL